jgi:DNA-binding winged helix-turn-helix (wHTH) protein/Tol biopolymer transport system component
MPGKIRFGVYELDRDAMELRKRGVLLRLQEQPLRVLAMLAERPGEIITREQLQEQIWGDTFVDFDQSLNKAVNRVREALNDNAGTPQYVETVPRRGYRFIAPVAEIPTTEAPAPPALVSPATPAQPREPPSRIIVIGALATTVVLAAIGIATIVRLRQPTKHALQEPRHITSFGVFPALSRDGKLLAYMSSLGGGTPHIWVQQTAGGEAIPVTTDSYPGSWPDFSPDGTRIVFYSARNGGGIYIASTLPGDPKLVVATPSADSWRFSPGGDSILYWQDQKAFTVSVDGGQPVALPLNQDFRLYGPPIWAPSGKEILFYGVRSRGQKEPAAWWIAPVGEGQPRLARLPGIEQNYEPAVAARAWIRNANDSEWIIYSTASLESWRLWRSKISRQGVIDENPELVASGTGNLGPGGSASEDGKLAYNIWSSSISIYQISISDRGQKLAPTLQLPLPEGGMHSSPSVSRDGKWMAYQSSNPGKANTILLRDLSTGTDHLLDDQGRIPGESYAVSISPDGSGVIFERDCKEGTWPAHRGPAPVVSQHLPGGQPYHPLPCGFMVAAAGGQPEQICEVCTPRGFSSNGSVVLLQKYGRTDLDKSRIVAFDLHARTEKDFLSLPDAPLFHPYFSWDDRWVVFKKSQSLNLPEPLSQILIAPVRHGSPAAEAEWIAVTDGRHRDDKPQFSADGNTLYFTSTRDGNLCIWAQLLDPVTKHPLGQPFAYEHFHDSAGRAGAFYLFESDLSVARDKILINLPEPHSDTWMTQMP